MADHYIYKPSDQALRKMQVKLIQNSKLINEADPKAKILKSFIKTQREIAIDRLPQGRLMKSNADTKNNLKTLKEKYLKKYTESNNEEDATLKNLSLTHLF